MSDELMLPLSPFDAIMLPSERWSARDLMAAMGYSRWENFLVPLARAQKAADNLGYAVAHHFLRSQKVVQRPQGGGVASDDVHLTRFAAYLVAMNGDPNKVEVAAAQAYFATKTREAEVAPAIPRTYAEALRAAADESDRADRAELERDRANETVAELAPKADAFDAFLNGEGLYHVGTVARMIDVGQNIMFRFLYEQHVLISSGPRRKQPYANPKFNGWFGLKPHDQSRTNGHAVATTMVTPRGAEGIRLLAIQKGLIEPALIVLPYPKEISA